jgi:RimJ/RimL family protein N-acetyltransferase
MGGVDSADLGSLALRACREAAGFQGSIEIAATSASPHLTSLRALVDSSPDTRLSIDQPDLTEFFTRHDLQIGAGGGATWERCCAGAPMLLLKAAENQVTVLQELSAQGAARCLNDSGVATVASVGQAVAELLRDGSARKSLAERARALVDGLGAQRVATAMTLDHLVLRPAKADDAALSFGWRNDHSSRQHSRDAAEINPDHHRQWWKDSLVNPNRQIFFGCLGSRDVGVLRLDFNGSEAEVSIYLAMTGLGLGPRILLAAQRWALEHTILERLVATILPSNTASMRAFSSAGFVRQEKGWVWTVSASQTSGQPAFPGA